MTNQLENKVEVYQRWREQMIAGIESYKSWVDAKGYADIQQSLRIYDLIESLRSDRMMFAFLAEFSRGKTELINAMLFSGLKQRLLPSNVGRTTMCPTEIFYDPDEGPYVRLLPIETRRRNESVSALKRQSVEWVKISLNIDAPEEIAQTMKQLTEVKAVSIEEAKLLGLWHDNGSYYKTNVTPQGEFLEVPAWRHAMISYPHPLLKNGLVVLDTPGLNALGIEPELTLSMIPSAHAVLFLLGMDTGVTQSDLEIWKKHIQGTATRRTVVLNKIDLMWDELKTEEQIAQDVDRQIETTAQLLQMPRSQVLAVSAQKALVARIRGDSELLAKSGIEALEVLLATEIIPAKQEIMRAAVQREIGAMVEASRLMLDNQLAALNAELEQLNTVAGKSHHMGQAMVARLENDQNNYKTTVETFQNIYETVMRQGGKLLKDLDDAALTRIINKNRKFIQDAWTTAGLWKNMEELFLYFTSVSKRILKFSNNIKRLVDSIYRHFHEKFGFAQLSPPALNLEKHTLAMSSLQESTKEFCHDPINVARYKHFLIAKFYESLVEEARQIFIRTRDDADSWLNSALDPLRFQIKQHEKVLANRLEIFRKIRDNIQSVDQRVANVRKQQEAVKEQSDVLARIMQNLCENPSAGQHAQQAGPEAPIHVASLELPTVAALAAEQPALKARTIWEVQAINA